MDIFSTAYPDPLRVEFLGDTVESVRLFDVATQTSIQKLPEGWVYPAREYIRPAQNADAATTIPPDAEWRAPDLYPQMDSLFDYMPPTPCLALDQPAVLKDTARRGSGKNRRWLPAPCRSRCGAALSVSRATFSDVGSARRPDEGLSHAGPRAARRSGCRLGTRCPVPRANAGERGARDQRHALHADAQHTGAAPGRAARRAGGAQPGAGGSTPFAPARA